MGQLDEARKELSSSQLIIQLLYKEISDITAEKMLKLTNTVSEYNTNSDAVLSNTWSTVGSKWLHNKNKTSIFDSYQISQPVESTNRFTTLANLPESTICYERDMMPKIHPKYTNKKEHGKIKQPAVSWHPRNTTQQPSRSHHVVHNEIVSEHLPKCIPTIVNGQINPTKKESNNNSANNFWDKIQFSERIYSESAQWQG